MNEQPDDFKRLLQDLDIDFDQASFDSEAPLAVDKDLVKKYVSSELDGKTMTEVRRLIATYWEWQAVFKSIVMQQKLSDVADDFDLVTYSRMNDHQLLNAISAHLGDERHLALRSGVNPIEQLLPRLKEIICPWWSKNRRNKEHLEHNKLMLGVANELNKSFPELGSAVLKLVTVYLVRVGLDDLCNCKRVSDEI